MKCTLDVLLEVYKLSLHQKSLEFENKTFKYGKEEELSTKSVHVMHKTGKTFSIKI